MGPPGSCKVNMLPATATLSTANPQAWFRWASFVNKVQVGGEVQNHYIFYISSDTTYELWTAYTSSTTETPRSLVVTHNSPTDTTVIAYEYKTATYGPVNPSVFAIPVACNGM